MSLDSYKRLAMMNAAMMLALTSEVPFSYRQDDVIHNGVDRVTHPWDTINIPKKERRGKSFEELQEMRKQRWEELSKRED